jgi:restriction system protein
MAEITRERSGQLMRKVFELLTKHPDGLPAREAVAGVEREVELTDFERTFYPKNPTVRRFEKIVRFSTIGPVKAGWMTKSHGVWAITDTGRRAYAEIRDPAAFMREAGRLYREWRRGQPVDGADDQDADTPGAETTLEQAEESAWAEIEAHLGRMNPYDFQELVVGLLRAMEYHVSWVAPLGPDKGVDVIAHKDPLGVEHGRIKVQVKRRADKIPVGEVRSFLAVLGEDDVGIFVASGGFTTEAETEARSQERRRIMLLDAQRLFALWVEHYHRVPEEQRRLLPLKAIHFLAPRE